MATTRLPVAGVFDRDTGQFLGVFDDGDKEVYVPTLDSKGQLIGSDGKVISAGTTTRYSSSIHRPHAGFNTNGNGTANNITVSMKVRTPVRFTWVRLWIMFRSASTPTAFKGLVAPTETFADNSDVNRYQPIIGGSAANVMASGNTRGWTNITWNGSTTAPNTPVAGTSQLDAFVVSDRIALNAFPPTDGGTGYYCMVRLNMPNDSGVYNVISNGITAANAAFPLNTIHYATRPGADGVATLAHHPTGTAVSDGILNCWLEFGANESTGTCVILGDSISTRSISVEDAAKPDAWPSVAAYNALTASGVGVVNLAIGSATPQQWRVELDAFLAQNTHSKVRYLVLPSSSPNFGQTADVIRANQLHVDQILDWANANGVKVFMWTPFAFSPAVGWLPQNQQVILDYVNAAAAAGRCVKVDINAAFPSGTAHLQPDGIHPLMSTCLTMRTVLQEAITANV